MLAETKIGHVSFISQGLRDKWCDEISIIVNAVYFPDDIVTNPQTIKDFIKPAEACCYPSVIHGHPLCSLSTRNFSAERLFETTKALQKPWYSNPDIIAAYL
jgi:hypothetical protein